MNISTKFTEKDWDKFTVWLKGILKVDVATITFIKKDGTERIMKCTLAPSLLPITPITESEKVRKINEDIMAVYDIELQNWRSFRIKSVKHVVINII